MTLVILAAGMGSRYGGKKQVTGFGPTGEWLSNTLRMMRGRQALTR